MDVRQSRRAVAAPARRRLARGGRPRPRRDRVEAPPEGRVGPGHTPADEVGMRVEGGVEMGIRGGRGWGRGSKGGC
eukprot:scaffold5772_cov105-Isochrysis_galbana.AAC.2